MFILEKNQNIILKAKIKNEHLENNVIMTGVVDNPNDYYNVFDLFVLPSKREGLPIVALEAQASGLKCLFSNTIDKSTCVVKDLCKFLPLEENKWVEEIKTSIIGHVSNVDINGSFKNRSLDIKREFKKLDKLYKEIYYE